MMIPIEKQERSLLNFYWTQLIYGTLGQTPSEIYYYQRCVSEENSAVVAVSMSCVIKYVFVETLEINSSIQVLRPSK